MRTILILACIPSIIAAGAACDHRSAGALAAEPGAPVVAMPKEIDDLLTNPGMGWQTFHRFADEDKNLAGLPSASAYFRFYWRELEPQRGQIDFARLDALLARARKAGQKLAFRVMCAGTDDEYLYVPAWLKEAGCRGFEYQYGGQGPRHWVPDLEDPLFQKTHFRLIAELGKRYDGHPDVDLVDIGTVGLWGEWHMSDTGVKLPGPELRLKIIDAWRKAFVKTPKVMLIGDEPGMRHAVQSGCGWRADCLGDMGGFSKTWNHMEHFYRQQIQKTDAADAWKTGPVAFESCWDMRKWKQEGWDIRAIFDYALDLHASYMNNKSAPIPEGTRPEVERFLRKLGYRLVLRRLEHAPSVRAGQPLRIKMIWENVGAAPPYRDDVLAIGLIDASGKILAVITGKSVKGWLPGKTELTESYALHAGIPRGGYTLAIGIVDMWTRRPSVRLAIAGREAEGWYPVGRIEVE